MKATPSRPAVLGETITANRSTSRYPSHPDLARKFAKLMFQGKFGAVMFDCIDADSIRHATKGTTGAAGPSGLDAHNWRICCTFKEATDDLCHSLTLLARRLCTQIVDHSILAPIFACRLIALD